MFQDLFAMLTTPDLPRALAFYRDLLGCRQTYQFPETGEPVYVGLSLGPGRLGIGSDTTIEPSPTPKVFSLCVYVDDCDTAVELLREHGVAILGEPVDQPWGERMAEVTDPDGNRIVLMAR